MQKITWFLGAAMVWSVALLTGLAPRPALAANRITAEVTTTPTTQLTDEERRALSIAAGRLFVHVDQARQAIAKNEKAGALGNIAKGLTLAQIIRKAEPDYTVKSSVKAGELAYEDEQTVKAATVPIFNELDRVSLEEPLLISKKNAAKNGAALGAPVVADVESMHTQLRLDIGMAQNHLEAAKAALDKGNLKLADASLEAIQNDSVIFEFDAANRPLVRARENLMLAKTMLQEGNANDARIELQAAADSLREYQRLTGSSRGGELQSMRDEIARLTPEIEKNQTGSINRITAMWDKLTKWF